MHVIFGLLDQPFASLDQLNLSRIHMGVQRVLMLRPDTPAPTLPPDVYTLDVRAPNVIIPNQETTYWCFIQTLPENMPKNHIVKVPVALQMETINMEFIYTHTYTLSRVGVSEGDGAQAAIIALCLPDGLNNTRASLLWLKKLSARARHKHTTAALFWSSQK